MKRFLSSILILLLILSLNSCEENSKKEAEKTLNNFFDYFCAFNFDKASEYIDNPSSLDSLKEAFDITPLLTEVENNSYMKEYSDKFISAIGFIFEKLKESMEYKVKSVMKSGADYVADVEITYISENFSEIVSEQTEGAFSKEAITETIKNMADEGVISKDMSDKELLDAIINKYLEYVSSAFEEINVSTQTENIKIVLSKSEDSWLISYEKSPDILKLVS